MWPLAVLTRDSINVFFFYEEMYGRFAGPKKSGRNNEVAVRRGSTVVEALFTSRDVTGEPVRFLDQWNGRAKEK